MRMLKEVKVLIHVLDNYNISALMLKGFSLKRHYPPDCLRTFSDIDLMIRPEDRHRCDIAFKETGYHLLKKEEIDHSLITDGEISWINPETGITVECHWDFVNSRSMREKVHFDDMYIFENMESIELEGIEMNVLKRPLELSYLMAHHVLHHQFDRLIWLADVLLILTEDIDLSEFKDVVYRLGFERPVHYYLRSILKIIGKEKFVHLEMLINEFSPASRRYHFFTTIHNPKKIFQPEKAGNRLRDHIFRNAFK